ncbi:MAG: asparagine synthase C-terminal domain-containing protein, partial [Promethearchaeota archaeon]
MTGKVMHSYTSELKALLIKAVSQALADAKNPGLLFSGGIDSSILAVLLSSPSSSPISLIVSGTRSSKDVGAAQTAALHLDLPIEICYFTLEELEKTLPEILTAAKSTDVLQISLAIPLFFAAARANELGISTLFTGQGADELFGGYARFERLIIQSGSNATIAEMKKAFNYLLVTTLPCQQAVAQYHKVKLAAPYLNSKVISFATNLPLNSKILVSEDNVIRKRILRQLAKTLHLSNEIIHAPKRAAQYGSGASRLLTKLAKQFW